VTKLTLAGSDGGRAQENIGRKGRGAAEGFLSAAGLFVDIGYLGQKTIRCRLSRRAFPERSDLLACRYIGVCFYLFKQAIEKVGRHTDETEVGGGWARMEDATWETPQGTKKVSRKEAITR